MLCLNHVVLAGELVELPEMKETANGVRYATLVLEIVRPFKNSSGMYDRDRVCVTLWKGIAETAKEVCKLGDLLGVKGRIQSYCVEKENQVYYNYEIIAEHVSFMRT